MTARYLLGKASKRCWRYPTAGNDHCGAGVVSQFENRECLASEEYSPPRRGGEAARSMKKPRSHLFPRRRARSASAVARSCNSGQFGAIFSRRRSDPPRPLCQRRLRSILLMSRPPLLCEEGNVVCAPIFKLRHYRVDGGVPMVTAILANRGPKRLQIATTDCEVRFSIIGQKGMKSLAEVKGKRLGISNDGAMTGFIYRALGKRMGWVPGKDFTVVERAQRFDDLKAGKADAFIADDRYMALAKAEGYPVLADTSTWKQPIAGNGVRVEWNWIKDPTNRDIAMRFLKATFEGMAVYYNNREDTLRVMAKYHGMTDRKLANSVYEEGLKMSREMFPCVQGFKDMFTIGYPAEIQKYKATDFYDETFIAELKKAGFIENVYKTVK